MSKLLEKIISRDKLFFNVSVDILAGITEKLNKAFQYLIKDVREVKWDSIELVAGTTNFVYVQGTFTPQIGDIVTYDDGSKAEITADTLNKAYRNFIRIMLPLKILEEGDAIEIFEKMKDYNQLNSLMSRDELIDTINSIKCEDLADILQDDEILAKITRPKQIAGFLTRDMTEQQVIQLGFWERIEREEGYKH